MKIHSDLSKLPEFKNAVLTIGSFDGVHAGHQQIIAQVNQIAQEIQGESILITFHPHPRLVVNPNDHSIQLLTDLEEKGTLLEACGLDHLVVVPFTKDFSSQSPDDYIENFLVKYFQPKRIVIGYDHRFGKNRAGDISYLKEKETQFTYTVKEIPQQEVQDIVVSSTKIRHALNEGDVAQAAEWMGHYFSLTGKVKEGEKIGNKIGFPTANIQVTEKYKLIPPDGVYAVFVLHEKQRYEGMLYIGKRPTLEHINEAMVEVNIFDFDKNIYGENLRVEFVEKTREDQAFDGLNALQAQLVKDKANSLSILDLAKKKLLDPITDTPSVAVVILNYNGVSYLEQFLPSVLKSTYDNYSIIVADNASTDDSIAFLKESYPSVRIISLEENYGFAKGYNEALKEVEADYFVLLNSDVEVSPNWIEPIIELMERDKTVAACQPKIKCYDDKARFEHAGAAGGWMDQLGYPFCRGRIFEVLEEDTGQYDVTQEVFWASGAAFFVRAQLYKNIGGLDSNFFAHMEEIDFCWRLKRAGYKIMVRPKSVVYHVGGGTLSKNNPYKTYLNFRNSLSTVYKNEVQKQLFKKILLRLILDGVAGLRFLFKGQFSNLFAIVKAHWHFFFSLSDLNQKKEIEAELIQKVSISTKANLAGIYKGSIVWQHFAKGKKYFRQLK